MSWTAERVERLKVLWAQGLSCSRIAADLGGVSRNSIIGKVYRLGLSGRAKTKTSSSSSRAPRTRAQRTTPWRQATITAAHAARAQLKALGRANSVPESEPEAEPLPASMDFDVPVAQRCTLFDLTPDTCRWPIGDPGSPDFHFCGAGPLDALPYCGRHARIAYQSVSERRRERDERHAARRGAA